MDSERGAGTGPGVITPDGCAVDFYALLPGMGEPEIIEAALPAGASVLELGCGTGRLLRPLAASGHPVTGVDESPEMLARIPELPTVCSPIETLQLRRTFGAVLLASNMINASPAVRRQFLATCRRHVAADGVVVLQQHDPAWFTSAVPTERTVAGIRAVTRSVEPAGPRQLRVVMEYHVGDRVWTHAFSPHQIRDDELTADLASAGLVFGRWLTEKHTWFTAHPLAQPAG